MYQRSVEDMYSSKYGSAAVKFERSIRTKGRDHMQIQMAPVPFKLVSQAISVFQTIAKSYSLNFHEVDKDDIRHVDELVLTMKNGPYQVRAYDTYYFKMIISSNLLIGVFLC